MSTHIGKFKENVSVLNSGTTLTTPMNVEAIDQIGYAVRMPASGPTGQWDVLYSNDYDPASDTLTDLTKWDSYTLSTAIAASTGAAQNFGVRLPLYEFKWVRLRFVATGGTTATSIVAYRGKGV